MRLRSWRWPRRRGRAASRPARRAIAARERASARNPTTPSRRSCASSMARVRRSLLRRLAADIRAGRFECRGRSARESRDLCWRSWRKGCARATRFPGRDRIRMTGGGLRLHRRRGSADNSGPRRGSHAATGAPAGISMTGGEGQDRFGAAAGRLREGRGAEDGRPRRIGPVARSLAVVLVVGSLQGCSGTLGSDERAQSVQLLYRIGRRRMRFRAHPAQVISGLFLRRRWSRAQQLAASSAG